MLLAIDLLADVKGLELTAAKKHLTCREWS
jgi:hypothetical protein